MTDSIHPIYTSNNYLNSLNQSGIYYSIIATKSDIENINADSIPQIYLIDCNNLDMTDINQALQHCSKTNKPTLLLIWRFELDLSHVWALRIELGFDDDMSSMLNVLLSDKGIAPRSERLGER